jgi:hypothetical protein
MRVIERSGRADGAARGIPSTAALLLTLWACSDAGTNTISVGPGCGIATVHAGIAALTATGNGPQRTRLRAGRFAASGITVSNLDLTVVGGLAETPA